MNSAELIERIKAAGIFPVLVEGQAGPDQLGGDSVIGTFQDYLEAAKACGAKVVLVKRSILEECEFFAEVQKDEYLEEDGGNESADPAENYDLTQIAPELNCYRSNIGKESSFLFEFNGEMGQLSYLIVEDWYNSFSKIRDEAVEKLEDNRRKLSQEDEEESSKRDEEIESMIQKLDELLNDDEFCAYKTQRGMLNHALEKFPDLCDLEGDYRLLKKNPDS